jgi:hypothetical protein
MGQGQGMKSIISQIFGGFMGFMFFWRSPLEIPGRCKSWITFILKAWGGMIGLVKLYEADIEKIYFLLQLFKLPSQ